MDAAFLMCWTSGLFLKRLRLAFQKEVDYEEYDLQSQKAD